MGAVTQRVDETAYMIDMQLTHDQAAALLRRLSAAVNNDPAIAAEWDVLRNNSTYNPRRNLAVDTILERLVRIGSPAMTLTYTVEEAEQIRDELAEAVLEPEPCQHDRNLGRRNPEGPDGCPNYAEPGQDMCAMHLAAREGMDCDCDEAWVWV